MSKQKMYYVQRWLLDVADQVMAQIVDPNTPEFLIEAAMGTGKTTFVKKVLAPYVKAQGDWLVMVLPGVAQLLQLEKDGIPIVCNGSSHNDNWICGTTPDSMHKVMERAKELGKKVWLVADEVHAIVTSVKFRESFLKIREYAPQCKKVINMTATAEPLIGWDLGVNIKIARKEMVQIPVTIQPVRAINIDTVYDILSSKYKEGEMLFSHYNNIANNNELAQKLHRLCEVKKETLLLEAHQENLFGEEPKFLEIDHTEKAVSLYAGNKNHNAAKALINEELPEQTGIMCMTSVVKEGMNIKNTRPSTVVVVWDKNLTYAELIQTIGRYRVQENIKEIIIVVKQYEEIDINYKPYETMLEEQREFYLSLEKSIQGFAKHGAEVTKRLESMELFRKGEGNYILAEELVRNEIYTDYCNQLRKAPNIIKKELENEFAVNLKVKIKEVCVTESKELLDLVKATKQEKADMLISLIPEICKYDDKTVEEILTHTIDQRLPEMQEATRNMLLYEEIVTSKFKRYLSSLEQYGGYSQVEAFRKLATITDCSEIDHLVDSCRAKAINRDIQQIGLEEFKRYALKCRRHLEDIPRQVLIREFLQEHERKRARLSKKTINALAEYLLEQGFYKLKTTNKAIIKEVDPQKKESMIKDLHKKNLAKATSKLMQDLEHIYVFKNSTEYLRISSIKT